MEVTAELYKIIKENDDKIFVGHQRCKVYDLINVKPCFNCGRFGHNGAKCHNDTAYSKCAGKHETHLCTNNTIRCGNCLYNNNKYKTKSDVSHSAHNSDTCPIFKSKIKKYIEMTDYPIKPNIPTYTGIADNQQKRFTIEKSIATIPPELLASVSSITNAENPLKRTERNCSVSSLQSADSSPRKTRDNEE